MKYILIDIDMKYILIVLTSFIGIVGLWYIKNYSLPGTEWGDRARSMQDHQDI